MVLAKDISCFEGEHDFEIQILGSLTSDHQTYYKKRHEKYEEQHDQVCMG